MAQEQDWDVAIAGGGPVGLMAACELRLAGLRVAVFERRTSRVDQSRALTLHGRTLEMLSLRGIDGRFTKGGREIPTGHYAVLDTRLDFSVFATTFPYTLFLPQATTERLLEERAVELGAVLHPGHVIERIAQDGASVTIEGTAGGKPFRAVARYLVGADGGRSVVRREAGIEFPGFPIGQTLMLGDVVLDAPPSAPVVSTVNAAGCIMVAPLGDGIHHRIVLMDPLRADAQLSEQVTLEEVATSAKRILDIDFRPRDPIWLSRFGGETRLATTYRQGRIFLAGDAAHVHMPAGGQGMNVGMQEAMNLCWKLAGVVRGFAPEALLDSYDRERRPVGAQLYQNTLAQTKLMSAFDPPGLALRAQMNELLRIPEVNRCLADEVSGFGVTYGEAPIEVPEGWRFDPAQGGRRVPDLRLRLAGGGETTLYALLHAGQWLRLRFPEATPPAKAPFADAWVRTADVTTASDRSLLGAGNEFLIRPDGYAGFSRD